MPAASLEVRGLTAGYGPTHIVEDVSFAARPASRLAVLGRNGAGKSTLLRAIAGLNQRHAGVIALDDRDIVDLNPTERSIAGVGYVAQERAIFRELSVEENLRVGLKGRPVQAIEEAYTLFPRLAERHATRGDRLSGGEQQMLSLARTLLGRPRLLLVDEPLEGLAPLVCDHLMRALETLARRGDMTIVLVEQKIEPALDFADHALVLERGRTAWFGSATTLRNDAQLISKMLGLSQ